MSIEEGVGRKTLSGGRWVAAGAAVVAFAFLLYLLRDLLNPFLIFLALIAVMLPFRRTPYFWPVVGAATGLWFFWLFSELGTLLAPFILGLVAAYVLNPVVDWIARRPILTRLTRTGEVGGRRSRTAAILALALPVLGAITGLFIWGIPALGREANELLSRAPELLDRVAELLTALEAALLRLRLPGVDGSEWVARIRALDGTDLVAFLEARSASLAQGAWGGVLGLGRGIGTLFSVLGYLVLTPVIAFYFMRDYRVLGAKLDGLIPRDRSGLRNFMREYDGLLSAYLRGQLTVAMLVGLLTGIGLWIAQFPYALLLGVLVAVLGIVPYLGLVLSLLPAIAIALTSGAVGVSMLKLAIVYGSAQGLEGAVISPRILGDSTGLHPVWILLSIALGGFFFGFVGLLIGVPVAVGLKLLVTHAVGSYRASVFFRGVAAGEPSASVDD